MRDFHQGDLPFAVLGAELVECLHEHLERSAIEVECLVRHHLHASLTRAPALRRRGAVLQTHDRPPKPFLHLTNELVGAERLPPRVLEAE